jgi:hypothetical protein
VVGRRSFGTKPESRALLQKLTVAHIVKIYWTDEGKVVPVLNQAPRHEDVFGNGGTDPCILNSALDTREWSALRPDLFTPGTPWIGGSVGSRADMDTEAAKKKETFPASAGNRTPVVQDVV